MTATTPASPTAPTAADTTDAGTSTAPTRAAGEPRPGQQWDSVLAALASGDRPPRPSALSASITHGWRALLKIKHVPEQLFDVTMFPIMMLLMFTYLFGGALAGSTGDYLQFFLPGILVATIVMITMYTGVGLNIDAEKGIFDRFRSLPTWRPAAIVGALLGDAMRYTIASVVIIGLGVILGYRPEDGVLGVLAGVAVLLVFAFSLSWVWTFLGLVLKTEKSVMGTSMMILMPLTFASNIYVDPETMPGWLEGFTEVNPVSIAATAVRGLMDGTVTGSQVGWVIVSSAVLLAVFAPLTMRRYATRQ